ncbi:hypothetical protein GCM10007147_08160 [Nocardiopsis kunsanensis]|uniref:Uncharacterized protein n=1 Tax=Nocardiopsis kunsanensis TaxID=141693 RepID=A0A918X973_9ACTN|nr:hypothetical protein GCM10007147_08160 [Nocardiopsis kunsanensis]
MAPVRVRGCAGDEARGNTDEQIRQAEARRRRNGPRKATFRRPITVRLRGKSCPAEGPDVPHGREKGSSREQERRPPQQADVGTKTRSAGRVAYRPVEAVGNGGLRRPSRVPRYIPSPGTPGTAELLGLSPTGHSYPPEMRKPCAKTDVGRVMTVPRVGIRLFNRAVNPPDLTGPATEGGQSATPFFRLLTEMGMQSQLGRH